MSVDGSEDAATRWQVLEEVLAAKRSRNDRLPIFLFGDELTAEQVPTGVLKHANAFMRLFEDSPEFLARVIVRAAQLYLERLPPPMFKALMEYTFQASYSWHTPGHGGGVAFRKSPVGQLFYEFFGENTLRSDISVSVGKLGSLLDHTGPIAEGERNAARIFGSDETLFVVGGTSTANKIVWHGTVSRGDLVLCDRNCHKSILHSLIMTGATPIYLIPSRNGLGIIGPISREQFTSKSIQKKIAENKFAKETDGKVRLVVMTNSTYDGLCYNIDAIKQTIGDAVEILHFDEAWFAHANFHEFYDGYHAISSGSPTRSSHDHLRHPLDAQALGRFVAGLDDPHPARRKQAAGHGSFQRLVHDAYLNVPAIRHHRLLRCRGGNDGAACRSCPGPGDDRGSAEFPARNGRRQEAGAPLMVVRRLAARRGRQAAGRDQSRTGS